MQAHTGLHTKENGQGCQRPMLLQPWLQPTQDLIELQKFSLGVLTPAGAGEQQPLRGVLNQFKDTDISEASVSCTL